MTMKNLIRKFLKLARTFALIVFLLSLAAAAICLVVGIIEFIVAAAAEANNDFDVNWNAVRESAKGCMRAMAGLIVYASCGFFSMIAIPRVMRLFEKAEKKADAKGCAIVAIVAGVLLSPFAFACAAGILMLIMKDEGYANDRCCCCGEECNCEENKEVVAEQPAEEEAK